VPKRQAYLRKPLTLYSTTPPRPAFCAEPTTVRSSPSATTLKGKQGAFPPELLASAWTLRPPLSSSARTQAPLMADCPEDGVSSSAVIYHNSKPRALHQPSASQGWSSSRKRVVRLGHSDDVIRDTIRDAATRFRLFTVSASGVRTGLGRRQSLASTLCLHRVQRDLIDGDQWPSHPALARISGAKAVSCSLAQYPVACSRLASAVPSSGHGLGTSNSPDQEQPEPRARAAFGGHR